MANPHKGEVAVTVGEKTYTLVFSTNAMAAAEEKLNRPWGDIAFELDGWIPKRKPDAKGVVPPLSEADVIAIGRKVRFSLLRSLVWAALQDHHEGTTIAEAGRVIDAIPEKDGGAMGLLGKLFERSQGASSAGQGSEAAGQPNP